MHKSFLSQTIICEIMMYTNDFSSEQPWKCLEVCFVQDQLFFWKKTNLRFPSSCISKHKHRMSDIYQFLQLNNFHYERFFSLQRKINGCFSNHSLKSLISFPGYVHCRKKVSYEAMENVEVIGHNFRNVEVSEGPH